jgi:imidazolonepropionase-like amidohydrolase
MKKLLLYITGLLLSGSVLAQDDVYPAKEYKGLLFIKNATVHIGNGQVLENATIRVNNGKIEAVGTNVPVAADQAKVIDASGKHVYPGLILSNVDLGLQEIANGVRGSNDYRELGDYNPSVRSIVAYNTDSKVIGTLRANGILLANVVPQGGIISGSSSVVQLDAWNWEDAAYKTDNGLHLNMPSLFNRPARFARAVSRQGDDPVKRSLQTIEEIKSFFREAKAYNEATVHPQTNLKLAAVRNLFDRKEKLFVHCDLVKEMLVAVDFVKEFGFDVVIVGGSESWQIAPLLKQNNIAVILGPQHSLPTSVDDDVDQPYKTPAVLQQAGVLFAINDDFEEARFRNLAFNAGTAAAYGLTKEEALAAITLNAARILGVEAQTGSLEPGKDANIVISEGDILDMRTSIVYKAFIQGREVSLENKQTQLYQRYLNKYGLNKTTSQ